MVSKYTPPAKIVLLIELGSHPKPTQIADALVYVARTAGIVISPVACCEESESIVVRSCPCLII